MNAGCEATVLMSKQRKLISYVCFAFIQEDTTEQEN